MFSGLKGGKFRILLILIHEQPLFLVLKLEKIALATKKKKAISCSPNPATNPETKVFMLCGMILKLVGIKSKITNQKCMNKHLILDKI